MLRPYFMRQRELLGDLARLAYETIKELMLEAAGDPHARPGVVVVPQTFGSVLNPHPHAHCLASRGVWNAQGEWIPVPYIDTSAAEKLFRHKIIRLLKSKDLLSDERIELLDSFRHSGFSVDASVTVCPQDTEGLERLCRYLLRCPLSLSRIHWTPGAKTLFYEAKGSHDDPSLLIRKARPSMSSSSWPESSRKSPSLGNMASTTWAPTPRERAPIEGVTSLCNRSPANKTPKTSPSRSYPPKSAPRSGKDGLSSSSAFIRPILSSATAGGPIASSPSSPSQSHTAREQASVTVHYRWHPRCDERLSVRWTQRHGGVTYYYCISRDGTRVSVPTWMTDAVHCAGMSLASSSQPSTKALAELGELLRAVLSRRQQEEVPSDETTDTRVSVRERPPALERAFDVDARDAASADAAATAGSSTARSDDKERKRGER